MKTLLSSACLIFATILSVLTSAARATVLSEWTLVYGTAANLDTDHPSFTAAGSSAMVAKLDTALQLALGEALTFSGEATFSLSGNAPGNAFRMGLFSSEKSSTNSGWLGYLAGNQYSGNPALYEKSSTTGSWDSTNNFTRLDGVTGGISTPNQLSSGTYKFSFSIERTSSGLLLSWSIIGTGAVSQYSLVGSCLDASPVTNTFDRIVIHMPSNSGQTSTVFANLALNKTSNIPEPSVLAFLAGGLLFIGILGCRWYRNTI